MKKMLFSRWLAPTLLSVMILALSAFFFSGKIKPILEPPPQAEAIYNITSNFEYGCFENIFSAPHSFIPKKTAPWSTFDFPVREYTGIPTTYIEGPFRSFLDVNGDGLQDMIYVNHGYGYNTNNSGQNYYVMQDCVMLNTGQGWSIAYKCATKYYGASTATSPYNYTEFYGDCAG